MLHNMLQRGVPKNMTLVHVDPPDLGPDPQIWGSGGPKFGTPTRIDVYRGHIFWDPPPNLVQIWTDLGVPTISGTPKIGPNLGSAG